MEREAANLARSVDLEIFDGRIEGGQLSLKVKSPDGGRTIALTGVLQGDSLTFTRVVTVAPGAGLGGPGLLGSAGPRGFTARRIQ